MKVKLILCNDSGCELDTIEAEAPGRSDQFSAHHISWRLANWELQNGDTIRVVIPHVAAEDAR